MAENVPVVAAPGRSPEPRRIPCSYDTTRPGSGQTPGLPSSFIILLLSMLGDLQINSQLGSLANYVIFMNMKHACVHFFIKNLSNLSNKCFEIFKENDDKSFL